MKQIERFQKQIRGLFNAIYRFPLTTVFLVILVIINTMYINDSIAAPDKYIAALVIGAFLGAVAQMIYERFFNKSWEWISLMIAAAILTLGYYLMISPLSEFDFKLSIKTAVMLAALFMAFIWVATIRSKVKFHESFMVNFKGFFISLLFSIVLFAGISIIFAAVDQLLIELSYKVYSHGANVLFALFAPMYYLSITPKYPGKGVNESEGESASLSSAITCPKYLTILISYIIIPITMVFTVILILYIFLNIGKEFWTNNLLEPMLVTYAITVIFVYLLSSGLDNKFANVFKKIFPKILIPIVLLQTISSIMKISDLGLTYGRYYVILFGVFAIFAGIIFSIKPIGKHGSVAALFIIFCIISILPPVDAFSISKRSQIKVLEDVLSRNEMLVGNQLIPKADISKEDQEIIRKTVENLNRVEDLEGLTWLPSDFDYYNDFTEAFGFRQYEYGDSERKYISLSLSRESSIEISGYDAFISTDLNQYESEVSDKFPEESFEITIDGEQYKLLRYAEIDQIVLKLIDENGQELITFHTKELLDYYKGYYSEKETFAKESDLMSIEEATYMVESEKASVAIISKYININESLDSIQFSADVYVLIDIKD